MRTIIDKIAESIERPEFNDGKHPLPFLYGDAATLNIQVDFVEPPLAAALLIESGAVDEGLGVWRERITLGIWFADKMCQAMGDVDARKNEHVITRCKRRAFKWISSLATNTEIRLVSLNGTQRDYFQKDAVLTGYWVNVTLEELEGVSNCSEI